MTPLWLPKKARRRQYKCSVPGCEREGRPFEPDEKVEYVQHVVGCQKSNEDLVQAAIDERDASGFRTVLDKEAVEWQRREKRGENGRGILLPRGV